MCFRPAAAAAAEKECPECGAVNEGTAVTCSECGSQLPMGAQTPSAPKIPQVPSVPSAPGA